MKKTVINFLRLLSLLVALSSCNTFPVPKTELCIATLEGDWACFDERRDPESYFRDGVKGDIMTNIDDYRVMKSYILDLQEKAEKCNSI